MIKVEVIERFKLKDFDKLKNVERKDIDIPGELFVGDTFECDEDMVKYLTEDNKLKKTFIKVIEIVPEESESVEEVIEVEQEQPKKKKTKKEKK